MSLPHYLCIFLAKEAERNRSIGMASLGGPFELVDQDGKPKTDKDFLGQWIFIYFGFCHCPDICPDQLEKITTVIETLGIVFMYTSSCYFTVFVSRISYKVRNL